MTDRDPGKRDHTDGNITIPRNHDRRQRTMTQQHESYLEIEDRGAVLIVRVDGGPHSLFGLDIANELEALVNRVDHDPNVHAVVFTGAREGRFVSHADVRWLQAEGAAVPELNRRAASAALRLARGIDRARALDPVIQKTPLRGVAQLDRLHDTFLRMNASGVIFVAALNGSALGLGAEFAWACDLRIIADDDNFFIGQPEVLLGIMPGGGGSQRLTRLIGTHKSLVAILEGKPFTPAEALANGAVDDVVPTDQVVQRAVEVAEYFGKRTKGSVEAIKRSVYFGGSMSLTEGLHVERTEFLGTDQSPRGQQLMLQYLDDIESVGELPLYHGDTYDRALEAGTVPALGAEVMVK
jgi:enoyl-CoA hydratase/carnithine racemase